MGRRAPPSFCFRGIRARQTRNSTISSHINTRLIRQVAMGLIVPSSFYFSKNRSQANSRQDMFCFHNNQSIHQVATGVTVLSNFCFQGVRAREPSDRIIFHRGEGGTTDSNIVLARKLIPKGALLRKLYQLQHARKYNNIALMCGLKEMQYHGVVVTIVDRADPFWSQAWLLWQIDVKITVPRF
jgi:hypothetical protein